MSCSLIFTLSVTEIQLCKVNAHFPLDSRTPMILIFFFFFFNTNVNKNGYKVRYVDVHTKDAVNVLNRY